MLDVFDLCVCSEEIHVWRTDKVLNRAFEGTIYCMETAENKLKSYVVTYVVEVFKSVLISFLEIFSQMQ